MTSDISQNLWKADEPSPNIPHPPSIPGMKVIRLLGAGGFGAVWLCEQQGPLLRNVAVKVMRTVIAGPRLRQRFESERRLLARMDHPGIAQVFDAGESQDGSLYFIMELVEGEPILDWCNRNRLSIESRLGLMRQVATAVQHAHTKGIIHLDLKSANILVREVDGAPIVKVIDFGVARLADDPDAVPTIQGDGAGPVGTLEYMAPEQLAGTRQLDTRADIYSLGVVLYQMLTGLSPFDSRQLRAVGTVEAQRIIRESEPEIPSERLRKSDALEIAEGHSRAMDRRLNSSQLYKAIQGQLDFVVSRCLEKDPERRYATCDALSEDINRWLAFEPVLARPASQGVRLRKFARRHRIGLTAAALIAIALIAGTVAMAYGLAEAKRQLARAERLHDFNTQMINSVNPEIAKGMDTRLMLMVFDQSMGEIDLKYHDDPILAADAHGTAGLAYRSIGEYAKALEHIQSEAKIIESLYAPSDLRVLKVQNELGNVLLLSDRVDEAAPIFEKVLEVRRLSLGEDDPATLASMHNLAWLRNEQGRPKEAEELYLQVVVKKQSILGADDKSTLRSMDNLADVQRRIGKLNEARATLEETVAQRTKGSGIDAPDTLLSRNNLCMVLKAKGDIAASEESFQANVNDMDRVLGVDHPFTLIAQNNLAAILRDSKRLAEAEEIYRMIFPRFEKRYGPNAKYTLTVQGNLAMVLEMQEEFAEAETIYLENLARKRQTLGDKAESTLGSLNNLGFLYMGMNRPIDAEKLWREAVTGYREIFGERSQQTAGTSITLARSRLNHGDPKEAEELVRNYAEDETIQLPNSMRLVAMKTHGRALAALEDLPRGMIWLAKSYELSMKMGDKLEAKDIAGKLVDVALKAGDNPTAEKWTQAVNEK
ncbi:MAG: serine/threonine-protein kinase [Planctomycetota bacterium]|nr:serine/threonine-protein kinase [Planctomycetota bacterium]MDA1261956.1 serine/threonine-protein kinase [Planctomycetota bacterium]